MDPGVTKAAIDAVRKQLRERLGGKVAGPPEAPKGGEAPPPPEGAGPPGGAPEQAEMPGMEGGGGPDAGGVVAMCPSCGFKGPMEPLPQGPEAGAGAPPPAAGPPPSMPPGPPGPMGPPRR